MTDPGCEVDFHQIIVVRAGEGGLRLFAQKQLFIFLNVIGLAF